jgi:hypothetical protein
VEYPRYREVSLELRRKIDRRIVEVHEQYPKWGSWKIATLVSNEFEVKVSRSVVERNIPEWRERIRERSRRYKERHIEDIRERERMLRERIRPYGKEILQIYKHNEGLDDDEIVDMIKKKCGGIASRRSLRTIVRYCRAARKGDGKIWKYVTFLSLRLGLPCPVVREELEIRYERRVGRLREVYEGLVALGGVATFRELREALGWDPRNLSNCLGYIKRRGLVIDGERRFVHSLLPDFTATYEGLMILYLPEKQREAEERAKEIALERLEPSFKSCFKDYYRAERNRKEAYRVIPFLRDAYEGRLIFTAEELISKSGCGIDAESFERALKYYARRSKALYNSGPYFSFWEEDLVCLRKVLELLLLE